ncbi:hypothetical protein KAX29_03980, partial [candidate division WOR-3 bacterium]|nr:hypothetical protein [candidate division WOR-3 bacterium]
SKNLIECDANVVYILDRYGNKLDEITSRNIAQGLNIELSEEMAKGRYGSYYKWKRITVDEEENLYVLLDANFMNGGGCRLIEFDNKGNINQEILYSSEYWIYQGSNRSFKMGIGDTDLEYYKEGSVLLIENGELYRIHDSKIQKAVEDIPHEALFDNPTAIEVDKNGNIYVSDFTLNKIKKYKPSGELIWSIGGYGKENGRFYCVGDLAVDDAGFLYATDNGNDRLQKFDSDGEFVSSFSVEPLYMYGTSFDIIVSGEKLKITEGNKVHIFNKDGELIEKRKSNIKMRIGSTFDKDNNLWTIDNTPFGPIIRVFDPQGEIIDGFTNYDFKGSLKTISDLKFDSQGNLWVVDTGSYQVKKYSIKWN